MINISDDLEWDDNTSESDNSTEEEKLGNKNFRKQ